MQYLVNMEFVEPGPLLSREQLAPVALNQTIPTTEKLIELSSKGKIKGGGVVAGGRAFLFIVDVASNDELDKLIQGLPAWSVMTTDVTPLQDFEKRLEQNQPLIESWKATGG